MQLVKKKAISRGYWKVKRSEKKRDKIITKLFFILKKQVSHTNSGSHFQRKFCNQRIHFWLEPTETS